MAKINPESQDDLPEFSFQAAHDRALEKHPLSIFFNEFWFQIIQEAARDVESESLASIIRSRFIKGMIEDPRFEVYKRRAIRGIEFDATEDLVRRASQTGEPSGVLDEHMILEAIGDVGSFFDRRDAYMREGEETL